MIPIFAKTKDGKWALFPYHLLEDYNGQTGIIIYPYEYDQNDKKLPTLEKFRHLFDNPYRTNTSHPKLMFYPLKLEMFYPLKVK